MKNKNNIKIIFYILFLTFRIFTKMYKKVNLKYYNRKSSSDVKMLNKFLVYILRCVVDICALVDLSNSMSWKAAHLVNSNMKTA